MINLIYGVEVNKSNSVDLYQQQIIEMYKNENEYLRQENKRLLDIIAVKEKKDLAKNIDCLNSNKGTSFFDKFLKRINKSNL